MESAEESHFRRSRLPRPEPYCHLRPCCEWKCVLCGGPPTVPTAMCATSEKEECGHLACRECITRARKSGTGRCPKCGHKISPAAWSVKPEHAEKIELACECVADAEEFARVWAEVLGKPDLTYEELINAY